MSVLGPYLGPVLGPHLQPITAGPLGGASFAELNLLTPTVDPRISYTGGPVSYVGADGLLHYSAANEWPLEYDPVTLQPVGRSAWEARTNLLLQSGAPATQGVSVTAQSYTLSFTGTGTVALSGAYVGSKTGTGSGPANRVSLTFTPTAGTLTVTPSGSVQNFQLEAAATPSPYIPTTSAQVTRAAQVATVNDLSTLRFNAAAGTIYVEWSAVTPISANGRMIFALYNASDRFNNRIHMESTSGGFVARLGTTSGGSAGYSLPSNAASSGKDAVAFDASRYSSSHGGSLVGTTAIIGLPVGLNALGLGGMLGYQLNGVLKRIRYYPRKLSDTELQALTA